MSAYVIADIEVLDPQGVVSAKDAGRDRVTVAK